MQFGKWAGLLLLAGAGVAGCKESEADQEIAAVVAAPELAEAEQRTLEIRAEAAGLVEPIATVEIKSKALGEVTNVLVESGQEVRRGTMLVEIEPRDVRNALSQVQADLEVARARASTAQAQYNRVGELRKANVATEQELESATLEQANAQAALVKARVNVELAQERMNDVTIKAPMDGMIIEKTVEPGVIISSASGSVSGGTTLLKMADLSIVQVRALVDQTDIGRVQTGQVARVSVEAYPNRPFEGTVVKIEPQAVVDQNVTMFPVLVQLMNPERLLKPGMNTEVEIEIARRPNAIVIPNDAVVGQRDAMTTAIALGMTEGEANTVMETMRGGMGGGPGGGGAPSVEAPVPAGPNAARPAGAAPADGARRQGAAAAPNAAAAAGPSPECAAIMQKSRAAREKGEQLAEADRTKARACFQAMGGGQQGGGQRGGGQRGGGMTGGGNGGGMNGGGMNGGGRTRGAGTTRPGFVFVPNAAGKPEPRRVMLGYSDFDYTEVISGLKAGEKVYLVTAARLLQQQKENNERMRARMGGGVPGMNTPGATQGRPGGGAPGGGGGGAPRGN